MSLTNPDRNVTVDDLQYYEQRWAHHNLATIEPTTTASKAYAVGDYFVYSGQLYKVTTAIASGGTIVTSGVSANVEATTVADELGGGSQSPIAILETINFTLNTGKQNKSQSIPYHEGYIPVGIMQSSGFGYKAMIYGMEIQYATSDNPWFGWFIENNDSSSHTVYVKILYVRADVLTII